MIKLALLAALILAASFASVQAWWIHRRRERVRATETTPIADCRPGFREVVGRVVPGEETLSPYLLKPCVWCTWTVEEHRKSGKSSSWVKIAEGRTEFPFDVDDGTGRIRVDPSGAEPHLMADAKAGMGTFDDPTPDLERFLKLVGVDPTALFGFNRKLRVTERVLAAGDEHACAKSVRWDFLARDPAVGPRQQAPWAVTDSGEEWQLWIRDEL